MRRAHSHWWGGGRGGPAWIASGRRIARRIAPLLLGLVLAAAPAGAGIQLGLLDDFEDGGLGGWSPPKSNTTNVPGGPAGSTRALEIRSGNRLAAFDAGADIAGAIDPSVQSIQVDMQRGLGADPLEIRLVLFGPGIGNRWTSTQAQLLPGDGLWATYSFSLLEADLTQVAGSGSYGNLTDNLNRIMFRHDEGAPDSRGTVVGLGVPPFSIDNVTAVVPEPGTGLLLGLGLVATGARRRASH